MRALILGLVMLLAHRAHADGGAVALLPFDTDKRLELYGQPVAHEIAVALADGKIDVVVVGPKMAVPVEARLIVDGTITAKGGTVVIAVRIRNPIAGVTLESKFTTAATLEDLDRAAAEVSAILLPLLKEHLAKLPPLPSNDGGDHGHVTEVHKLPAKEPVMLVAITTGPPSGEPLKAPLEAAVAKWAKAHHREQQAGDASKLIAYTCSQPATCVNYAPKTVADASAALAVTFEIDGFDVWPSPVFMARARVHVLIADREKVLFDRVVATDTVVGDKGKTIPELAVRVADEVLAILRPHIKRVVPTW